MLACAGSWDTAGAAASLLQGLTAEAESTGTELVGPSEVLGVIRVPRREQ